MIKAHLITITITVTANCRRKVQQTRSSNKVEPTACKGAPASRYTVHVWSWSTAPQPDGLDWESILRREETGVPGENPRSQVEIDRNSIPIQHLQWRWKTWLMFTTPAWLPVPSLSPSSFRKLHNYRNEKVVPQNVSFKAYDSIAINLVPGVFWKVPGNEIELLWTRSRKSCVLQKKNIYGAQESRNEFMQYFWLVDNYEQEVISKNI